MSTALNICSSKMQRAHENVHKVTFFGRSREIWPQVLHKEISKLVQAAEKRQEIRSHMANKKLINARKLLQIVAAHDSFCNPELSP